MKSPGFTLFELIVVLAIIGIVAGIFGMNLIRNIRAAELREATNNVASDLRRARSTAQRGSVDQIIAWDSGEVKSYKLDGKDIPIINNVSVTCLSGCGSSISSLTYQAPYGELSRPQGYVFRFSSPMNGITPIDVKVVGVTGKVITSSGGS